MESKHNGRAGGAPEHNSPAPWDEPHDGDPRPTRHDAFTPARRRVFLRHLAKTGCIADAARLTGVAARTVNRHQQADFEFDRFVRLALEMSGGGLEQIAWERAVTGVTEAFACGGKVHVRQRYSEGLLRLLLQATNPKKYGPRPGFTRKRLRAAERKEIEREIRREKAEKTPTFGEACASLDEKLGHFGLRQDKSRLALGWTRTDSGDWVPPGYIRDPGWMPPAPPPECLATPRDSV